MSFQISHKRCSFRRTGRTTADRALASALSCALLLGLGLGHAQAGEVSGELTLTSDYLFRGITQTNEEPALQGGIEYGHESGFYAGAWGSSISWLADSDPDISSQVELDFYLGYGGDFGDSGFSYDVGAIYYWYPGDYPSGFNSADTAEIYAGISWNILSLTYSYALTDWFGVEDSDGSSALELGASWEFSPSWTLDGTAGKQWVENDPASDYAYWSLGVGKSFDGGFSVAAAYNDNDLIGPDETWTLTVTKSF